MKRGRFGLCLEFDQTEAIALKKKTQSINRLAVLKGFLRRKSLFNQFIIFHFSNRTWITRSSLLLIFFNKMLSQSFLNTPDSRDSAYFSYSKEFWKKNERVIMNFIKFQDFVDDSTSLIFTFDLAFGWFLNIIII